MAIAKKKKRFFNVDMPLIRKTTQLQAFEIKELGNRFIKYDLTRLLKGKSSLITLRTEVLDSDVVSTKPYELRLLPCYLKRMVRRGTSYVEDSFVAEAKDGSIQIKPFLVTRRKVSRAVRKALRNMANSELTAVVKESSIEDIFSDVLRNKIQKDLAVKLKKIYPLALCEIRVLKTK